MKKWAMCMILGASGCGSDGFPDDFRFGVSVAGFQVDMGCPTIPAAECEDPSNDWFQFVTSTVTQSRASNFLSGDPMSRGPGFYELMEEDLDRVQTLGLDTFRTSIEWSRIFPTSTRGIEDHEALKAIASPAGLAYYRRQLDAIQARGLMPVVTLHHYTLPTWVHDGVGCNSNLDTCSPRGWLEPWVVDELAKYAGFVAKEYGASVQYWITENEPMAVVLAGYLQPSEARSNPPAQRLRLSEARTVMNRMIQAHAAMYTAIHAGDPDARVGLVYATAPVHPRDPNKPLDVLGAQNVQYLLQDAFMDAIVLGKFDEDLNGTQEQSSELTGRSDFIGVNYYTRVVVSGTDEPVFPDLSPMSTFDPLTLEQGPPYAPGMYEVLAHLHERYPDFPIFITENGASDENDMPKFMLDHLEGVEQALEEEIPVVGYLWWTLMDNYEWNHGMNIRMGLYEVDTTKSEKPRKARPVASTLQKVAEARSVEEAR